MSGKGSRGAGKGSVNVPPSSGTGTSYNRRPDASSFSSSSKWKHPTIKESRFSGKAEHAHPKQRLPNFRLCSGNFLNYLRHGHASERFIQEALDQLHAMGYDGDEVGPMCKVYKEDHPTDHWHMSPEGKARIRAYFKIYAFLRELIYKSSPTYLSDVEGLTGRRSLRQALPAKYHMADGFPDSASEIYGYLTSNYGGEGDQAIQVAVLEPGQETPFAVRDRPCPSTTAVFYFKFGGLFFMPFALLTRPRYHFDVARNAWTVDCTFDYSGGSSKNFPPPFVEAVLDAIRSGESVKGTDPDLHELPFANEGEDGDSGVVHDLSVLLQYMQAHVNNPIALQEAEKRLAWEYNEVMKGVQQTQQVSV